MTECIKENMILKKIARHCVDDTSGLFITLPEDDLAYQDTFVKACLAAGINAEVIDPEEAKRMEPSVNPSLIGAVKVPDGSVDPFRLCASNVFDAKIHGAKVLVYSEVIEFIKEQDTIKGVKVLDHHTGIVTDYYAPVTQTVSPGTRMSALAGLRQRLITTLLTLCAKISNAPFAGNILMLAPAI